MLAALFLVPWATPSVVNGLMWKWIYIPGFGALNGLLKSLGLIDSYLVWLADPDKTCPDRQRGDLEADAARRDPAPRHDEVDSRGPLQGRARRRRQHVQRFLHVTLPSLRPGLMLVLVYETMISIRHFDLFMILTQGGPGNASSTLSWQIYVETFRNLRFGSAPRSPISSRSPRSFSHTCSSVRPGATMSEAPVLRRWRPLGRA